ncbi:MAG: YccF domain-containing protein [Clostridia bacterium]|nr:YccF domain-containing protein [Clostridia bacterium]
MRTIANVIWFLFGGLILGLLWCCAGLILCITVIGFPLALQCFKAANLSFFPFGKKVSSNFSEHPIANLIWLFIGGWGMAIAYLIFGLINCITIIGIPNGLQCFKMMKLAFFPFGAKIIKR